MVRILIVEVQNHLEFNSFAYMRAQTVTLLPLSVYLSKMFSLIFYDLKMNEAYPINGSTFVWQILQNLDILHILFLMPS